MNLVELDHALRQLRLSGMAAVLETRLRQAQTEKVTPSDLVSMLVSDELLRRQDRLLERRHKLARFRAEIPACGRVAENLAGFRPPPLKTQGSKSKCQKRTFLDKMLRLSALGQNPPPVSPLATDG